MPPDQRSAPDDGTGRPALSRGVAIRELRQQYGDYKRDREAQSAESRN